MTKLTEVKQATISEWTVEAGQRYLNRCGALDDPSLVLYHGFAQHMLEKVTEESGEPWGSVTESMKDRAIEYFSRYFDVEEPFTMTSPSFVRSLLSYALLGVNTHTPEAGR